MHIATGERSAATNPTARALLEQIAQWEDEFDLADAHVFLTFPYTGTTSGLCNVSFTAATICCALLRSPKDAKSSFNGDTLLFVAAKK